MLPWSLENLEIPYQNCVKILAKKQPSEHHACRLPSQRRTTVTQALTIFDHMGMIGNDSCVMSWNFTGPNFSSGIYKCRMWLKNYFCSVVQNQDQYHMIRHLKRGSRMWKMKKKWRFVQRFDQLTNFSIRYARLLSPHRLLLQTILAVPTAAHFVLQVLARGFIASIQSSKTFYLDGRLHAVVDITVWVAFAF